MDPFLAGSLATGAASFLGGLFTNAANRREARRNRAFQERMSSTAAQRSAEDYRRAGFNPALAYDRPASSPGGSQAQLEDPTDKAISSGLQAARFKWENEAVKQQAHKTAAETEKTKVEAANAIMTGDLLGQQKLLNANELAFRQAIQPHQTRAAALANLQSQFGLSKAEAESAYWKFMGPSGVAVDNLAGPVGGVLGAGAGLAALLSRGGIGASSAKSLQGLFRRPQPRRVGDWERAAPKPERRPRGFQENTP